MLYFQAQPQVPTSLPLFVNGNVGGMAGVGGVAGVQLPTSPGQSPQVPQGKFTTSLALSS